jgi:hypothetical protein
MRAARLGELPPGSGARRRDAANRWPRSRSSARAAVAPRPRESSAGSAAGDHERLRSLAQPWCVIHDAAQAGGRGAAGAMSANGITAIEARRGAAGRSGRRQARASAVTCRRHRCLALRQAWASRPHPGLGLEQAHRRGQVLSPARSSPRASCLELALVRAAIEGAAAATARTGRPRRTPVAALQPGSPAPRRAARAKRRCPWPGMRCAARDLQPLQELAGKRSGQRSAGAPHREPARAAVR